MPSETIPNPSKTGTVHTADNLVRDMYCLLWADQQIGIPLLATNLEWMARARDYLNSQQTPLEPKAWLINLQFSEVSK